MKTNPASNENHFSPGTFLRKFCASVLAFAVTLSAFTGMPAAQVHAADPPTPADCGAITKLVAQDDLQKGMTIGGEAGKDNVYSYSWPGSEVSATDLTIGYQFTIPADKLKVDVNNKIAAAANNQYDLQLPQKIRDGVLQSAGKNPTDTFTDDLSVSFKNSVMIGVTSHNSYTAGKVQVTGGTDGKAVLIFGKNKDGVDCPDYDKFLGLYSDNSNLDNLPACSFTLTSTISKKNINPNK
ncbi:MAG: hypothetical protein LKF71_07295, partial [Oscillospiraceae bacterium]|nr:hypothetical protein [Oscillospiraceae bacterium]